MSMRIMTLDATAKRVRTGEQTEIAIASPDYWPLPWYLRNYSHVNYTGGIVPFTEPIIIASSAQVADLMAATGSGYQMVHSRLNPNGTYILRPGIELLIFVRSDLTAE